MKSTDFRNRFYRRLGPVLSSALAIGICIERVRAYNNALADDRDSDVIQLGDPRLKHQIQINSGSTQPSRQLGAPDSSSYQNVKTRQQACETFDGRVVAYYDQTGLVRNCRFRLITDPLMLNLLRNQNAKEVTEIPASVYRLLPHGEPIQEGEAEGFEQTLGIKMKSSICRALEKQIVTATGLNFFYVENCKKRLFPNYASLQEQSDVQQTIKTITPAQLDKLESGPDMPNMASSLSDIWIKIDGDVTWQRSFRSADQGPTLPDSPEQFRKTAQEAQQPVNKNRLCSEINGRLVSFYGHVYFVENCSLREVEQQSLELQIAIEQGKGIRDLTASEKRLLKDGRAISPEDALKRLR